MLVKQKFFSMTLPGKKLQKSNSQVYGKLLSFCFVSLRFCKVLFSLASISFFQLATDIDQGEIENPAETDIEVAEIDDETDKGKYCEF